MIPRINRITRINHANWQFRPTGATLRQTAEVRVTQEPHRAGGTAVSG